MKRMLLLVATLSLAAGSAAAQSLPDLMKQMIAAWNKPTEPFKVIDNIYYVGTNG
ncbi:MAG: subclass B3 metallo-beta-lactamase, partial [Bradyrhizobium sp.]|nr:subclass B3 metallo-beta-lactamase [Bradyrhizobium sp.]